jgi:hypothetical protein
MVETPEKKEKDQGIRGTGIESGENLSKENVFVESLAVDHFDLDIAVTPIVTQQRLYPIAVFKTWRDGEVEIDDLVPDRKEGLGGGVIV